MESEIYNACRNGDFNYVQALVETSSFDADINPLESNGSTALHIACSEGYTDIVRLLLNDHRVDRHRLNKDGQTAFKVASTTEIRQLFHRPKHYNTPFCTDENTSSPLEVIVNENRSESQWIHTYPTAAPILTECYHEVLDEISAPYHSIFDWCKSLFGYDSHKEKINKWLKDLEFHIEQCLIHDYLKTHTNVNNTLYLNACKCIKKYEKTRNIEHLLRLYSLDTSICRYFAQNSNRSNFLYAPIRFDLFNLSERAYQGICFRGLTMHENEFAKYQQALECKGSYIKTNTFCSTSINPLVAEMFTDTNKIKDIVNVIMIFEFIESCSTSLILFSRLPQLKCISNFEDEEEVLILPGTIFSVKDIQDQTHLKLIYLEHYNTDEEKGEMHQERFKSYIDSIILD
jgi:hypothetical protein